VVELVDEFRGRLDAAGQRQYSAGRTGNRSRASTLRQQVADGRPALGAGGGRCVYPLPDRAVSGGDHDAYVLKFAVPNDRPGWDGKAQNRHEADVWERTRDPRLVPVVAADREGYWLVMPRGEAPDDDSAVAEWLELVADKLPAGVWETDLDPRNVVRLGDEYRLCDYGFPANEAGDGSTDEPGAAPAGRAGNRNDTTVADAIAGAEAVVYCPECSHARPADSSLQAGDFCPECHTGTVRRRSDTE